MGGLDARWRRSPRSTTRIELGPLVACTNFHNPALLAKQAATIDEISGGRFVLGLGAGWNETEFRAFGFPFDHRIDRFEEAFTIIRTLLRDGAIDFDGRWYQARDCELLPRGPRPDGPPLMIGSIGPRMLRATMPHADSWNVWYTDIENRPAGVRAAPGPRRRRPAATSVATRRRSNGRSPCWSGCRAGPGRLQGRRDRTPPRPLDGDAGEHGRDAARVRREGIAHVQLVLDPITREIDPGARAGPRASSIAAMGVMA